VIPVGFGTLLDFNRFVDPQQNFEIAMQFHTLHWHLGHCIEIALASQCNFSTISAISLQVHQISLQNHNLHWDLKNTH
jgi:hypothetical protein